MRRRVALILIAAALTGCVTVQNAKTLEIPPSASPVAVTSTARAQCWDLFFILYCRLHLRIDSSTGQSASDFSQ